MKSKNKVLVLEGITRECLAVVRSLGRQGLTVEVGDCNRVNPARYSKYVSAFHLYPDPKKDMAAFELWLLRQVKHTGYEMVFPLNDHTFEACTRLRDELGHHTILVVNDFETFEMARDKRKTIELAQELGVPAPKTWMPDCDADLDAVMAENPGFPLLLKPSKSSGSRGVKLVHDRDGLYASFKALRGEYGDMLLQEYIPGTEILDVPTIFNRRGEHRGSLVNNRIRMFPRKGGPNIAGHAVENEDLRRKAVALLEGMGWKGVGLVEFKMDPRDGIPKLMEINPRFWGTTQLGISSGIDWPWMLYQIGCRGDCEEVTTYRTDMLMRWLVPGELLYLLTTRNAKDLDRRFFKLWDSKAVDCIFSLEDWKPGLGLLATCVLKVFDPKMVKFFLFR